MTCFTPTAPLPILILSPHTPRPVSARAQELWRVAERHSEKGDSVSDMVHWVERITNTDRAYFRLLWQERRTMGSAGQAQCLNRTADRRGQKLMDPQKHFYWDGNAEKRYTTATESKRYPFSERLKEGWFVFAAVRRSRAGYTARAQH
jgi:hypothetical protein